MRKIVWVEENIPIKKASVFPQIEPDFSSSEIDKVKEELQKIEQELLYRNARQDTNVFCELVMRDQQTSQPFKQARVHRTMQNHITWCIENGYFAGIMAPWGFGKSAARGSLVTMSDGTRKKIEDVKVGNIVLSLDNNLDYTSKMIKDVIYHGEKEVFKIRTRTGRELHCSATNPFFTIKGWKRTCDLNVGNHIALVREYYFEGKVIPPKYIPEFLGLMMGNGCCTDHPGLSDSNPDIHILLRKIVEEFNWEIGFTRLDQKNQPSCFYINKGKSRVSAKDILVKYKKRIKEEAPYAYKPIAPVIESIKDSQIARVVAKLMPLCTVKG